MLILMKVEDRYRDNCNGFGQVVALYHAICRYFGAVLLQFIELGAELTFHLAPNQTLRGRLLVI